MEARLKHRVSKCGFLIVGGFYFKFAFGLNDYNSWLKRLKCTEHLFCAVH